jgi:hypothetical protein
MDMRRLIPMIGAMVFLVLLGACEGGTTQTGTSAPEQGALTVTFDYETQSGRAGNQFAVWIEDAEGNLVKTLYATDFTANGGYAYRPESIPLWVEKSSLASMTQSEVDAVTGTTPKSGTLSYAWDLSDANGDAVPPGAYGFFVEVSLRWKNRVLFSGIVEAGGASTAVKASAEYFYEASDDQVALSGDSRENAMIGEVTASWN